MPINALLAGDLADLADLPVSELTITPAAKGLKPGGKVCCGCQCLCTEDRCYCCCCG